MTFGGALPYMRLVLKLLVGTSAKGRFSESNPSVSGTDVLAVSTDSVSKPRHVPFEPRRRRRRRREEEEDGDEEEGEGEENRGRSRIIIKKERIRNKTN